MFSNGHINLYSCLTFQILIQTKAGKKKIKTKLLCLGALHLWKISPLFFFSHSYYCNDNLLFFN